MQKKYSDWMKVDLHIHTDKSRETKENDYQGSFSVDTLKTKLRECQVEILSLTDHNIINANAYQDYYDNYSDGDPLLLLGVELDILVENNGSEKTYHSILLFNISGMEGVNRINNVLERRYATKGIVDKKKRKISIDDIVQDFMNEQFFFIPHAGNTQSIVDANRGNIADAQRMIILMESALEKVSEKAKQTYNNGFNSVLHDSFQNREDIAYLECSDNHNIAQYPCKHKGSNGIHEHFYIKGKKNFETIRLAFIDPESRIKSPKQYSDINKALKYIEGVKICKHRNLKETELSFSPHLNVLIGGRSSGKSLLMYLLGSKIDSVSTDKGTTYDKVTDINKVTVKSSADSSFCPITSISPEPIYVNQGDIVNYFENKKLYDLAKKSGKKDEYDQALREIMGNVDVIKQSVEDVYSNYRNFAENIEEEFVLHQSEVEDIFNDKYVVLINKDVLISLDEKEKDLEVAENKVRELIISVNNIENCETLLFSDAEKMLIGAFRKLLTEKIHELVSKRKTNDKKIYFANSSIELIDNVMSEQDDASVRKNDALKLKSELISRIGKRLSESWKHRTSCKTLEDRNCNIEKSIPLFGGIELILKAQCKSTTKVLVLEGINKSNPGKSIYLNLLDLLLNRKNVKNFMTNKAEDLRKKMNTQLAPLLLSFEEPEDYLKYSDTENSLNRSPGFNSEKYLEVLLAQENHNIIFIDQPEDNLGNKFIADELVNMIRELKFKKQVFLVTHNPSVVVHGDAENIVIAENNNKEISYRQIVLEDESAQKEICSILDGGDYIFYKRSRKYNIKRLRTERNKAYD